MDSPQAHIEHALDELRTLVQTGGDRRTVAATAADVIRRARGYRWVGLYDVTDTGIAAIAWTGTDPPAYPSFPRTQGLNGAAVSTGEPVISQDVATDPRYLTAFATTGSEAIFPVATDAGDVVGTVDVESDRRNAFAREDERFLRECARALRPLWHSYR
jgi:L-methionine (R)-S-oxide reductase